MAEPTPDESARADDARATSTLGPELGVAAFLMALAALVIADSVRVGTGWADDGPRAGYFPFAIGAILFGAAGWIFVAALRRRRRDADTFATRGELAGVWAVLWPAIVCVAAMPWAGLYAASALLIAWFMRRHGSYGWPATVLVSAGVAIAFFLVFERWFLVPLPKGPLEAALGL